MIAAAAVLAVLIIICFLRVGVVAMYVEDGFVLNAYFGPVVKKILPSAKTKKGKRKEKEEKATEGVIKAGKLDRLKEHIPSLRIALARLKRKLLIKELTIYYMAAGTDPAATALYFGGVSAGYGMILPLLENNFNIKKRDLRATVNFEVSEPYIYVKAVLSLAVWEVFYVAFSLLVNILKGENMRAKLRKAV